MEEHYNDEKDKMQGDKDDEGTENQRGEGGVKPESQAGPQQQ